MRKKRIMTNNETGSIPDFKNVKVRLRPFLGIKPQVYVPVIYIVLLVLIVFFVFFYFGIKQNGRYYFFESYPLNAGIYLDGNYVGHTPTALLLKSGTRKIEISKPFYKPITITLTVKPYIFETLFYNPKKRLHLTLELSNFKGLIRYSEKDFASNPYIPSIISATCQAAFSAFHGKSEKQKRLISYDFLDFLRNCLYFSTNESQIRELLWGFSNVVSRGDFLTPLSLNRSVDIVLRAFEGYNSFPYFLALALREKHARKIVEADWFKKFSSDYVQKVYEESKAPLPGYSERFVTVDGIHFSLIPGGSFLVGNTTDLKRIERRIDYLIPTPVEVSPFYMSTTEISVRDFLLFLRDNPEWRKTNKRVLLAEKLVSDTYLSDIPDKIDYSHLESQFKSMDQKLLETPIRYVSYWAARAYTKWLTEKLKKYLPGMKVRLPFETEWEWAARGGKRGIPYAEGFNSAKDVFYTKGIRGPAKVGSSSPNGYGLRDMSGNVWEWCENWFSPVSYFLNVSGPKVGAEKVVRGGSWANKRELIPLYIRGSQPPSWCTPYTGFRVVLVRENSR